MSSRQQWGRFSRDEGRGAKLTPRRAGHQIFGEECLLFPTGLQIYVRQKTISVTFRKRGDGSPRPLPRDNRPRSNEKQPKSSDFRLISDLILFLSFCLIITCFISTNDHRPPTIFSYKQYAGSGIRASSRGMGSSSSGGGSSMPSATFCIAVRVG